MWNSGQAQLCYRVRGDLSGTLPHLPLLLGRRTPALSWQGSTGNPDNSQESVFLLPPQATGRCEDAHSSMLNSLLQTTHVLSP